jgi:Fe2+ transport system protein FeoA
MNLKKAKSGQKVQILSIPTDLVGELLRLGVSTGDVLTCVSSIPGGPVVLQQELQELALGQAFAKQIECKLLDE